MLRPTIPPIVEPVTLAEARLACKMSADDTALDSRLVGYIAAARGMAEQQTGLRLLPQTWEHYLDAWPSDDRIELPQLPVRSITSVKYTSTAGVLTTVSSGAYRLDTRELRAVLQPIYGGAWPTDVRSDDEGVIVITYVCGLVASANDMANVAPGIREWMLAHVVSMNDLGAAVSAEKHEALPYLSGLLDPWRVYL